MFFALQGDSGSPLMCRNALTGGWSLLGIFSQGPSSCGETATGPLPLFMKVHAYLNWIEDTLSVNKR